MLLYPEEAPLTALPSQDAVCVQLMQLPLHWGTQLVLGPQAWLVFLILLKTMFVGLYCNSLGHMFTLRGVGHSPEDLCLYNCSGNGKSLKKWVFTIFLSDLKKCQCNFMFMQGVFFFFFAASIFWLLLDVSKSNKLQRPTQWDGIQDGSWSAQGGTCHKNKTDHNEKK